MKKDKSSSSMSTNVSAEEPQYIRELNRVWAKDKKMCDHAPYGTVDLNEVGKVKKKQSVFAKISGVFSKKKQTVKPVKKTVAVSNDNSNEPDYIKALNAIWAKDKKNVAHEPYGTVDLNTVGNARKNRRKSKPETEKKKHVFIEKVLTVLKAVGSFFAKLGKGISKVAVAIALAVAHSCKKLYKKLRKSVLKMLPKKKNTKKKTAAKAKKQTVKAAANRQQSNTKTKVEKKFEPVGKNKSASKKQVVAEQKPIVVAESIEDDEPKYIKELNEIWSKDKKTNEHEPYGTVDLNTVDRVQKKAKVRKERKDTGKKRTCAVCGKLAGMFKISCARGGFKLAIGIAAVVLAICFFVPVKTINNVKGSEASYSMSFASVVDDMRITSLLSEIDEKNETAESAPQSFGGYIAFIIVIHVALAACGVWLIHSRKTEQLALFATGVCLTAYILMSVWTNLGACTLGISALGVIVMILAVAALAAMFVYQVMYCSNKSAAQETTCEIEM